MPKTTEFSAVGSGKGWSSKSLASRLHHEVFYWLLRLGGLRAGRILLIFVVAFYCLRPSIVRRIRPYVSKRFPDDSKLMQYWRCARIYWEFGNILLERAAAGILGTLSVKTDEHGESVLKGALDKGKGVIILSAHVGCWQVALAGLSFGVPVSMVYHRYDGDVDRHIFEHGQQHSLPEIHAISPLDGIGSSVAMATALQKGEILCIMGDRLTEHDRLYAPIPFLGEMLFVPGGPYLLASATGAPIVVSLSRHTGPCAAECYVYAEINVPKGIRRTSEGVAPYAQEFVDALERFVQEYPYQFFNFYDVWQEPAQRKHND